MTKLQRFLATGGMLNSALYLSGCFIAGLYTANGTAWRLSLAALGATYLTYNAQCGRHWSKDWLLGASIALGIAAGLALLV